MNDTPGPRHISPEAGSSRFVERLRDEAPTATVELRPPRSGLTRGGAMDMWIDLSHAIRGLAARDAFLMLTDSAVGEEEEENLQHLTANLANEVEAWRVVPFLTCLHPLDYCLRYGDRARERGVESLTVTGGDRVRGAARCVPRGYMLRHQLRDRAPGLSLGGWVNLHRPIAEQIGFATAPEYEADYYLTQVVSHHDLPRVERWLVSAEREGLAIPGSFGVFYYRNGRRSVLERLSRFFPVPLEAVAAAFEAGVTPERHCAETIVALRRLGAAHVYLCNLAPHHAATQFDRIMAEVAALEADAA
ncbi:hypothetical protein [Candidatus Palauibacter sp.]|uniref:hypothetical protein n=1 Tax=Candidatus Palauibacter sp. TaxID=3101350 RepID=UPI003AF241A3